jgi:hypothetical protein
MNDVRLFLTPDEAISALPEGEYVHNTTGGMIRIGVDYTRAGAEEALRTAHKIEIGGPACRAARHPIVMWDSPTHCTFFEADMDKLDALEADKLALVAPVAGLERVG